MKLKATLACVLLICAGATASTAQDLFIAGVTPWQRPPTAPVVTQAQMDEAWMDRAQHGIEAPIPESLRFLADQGAWFTPFTHPGMTGPYDIRLWH